MRGGSTALSGGVYALQKRKMMKSGRETKRGEAFPNVVPSWR
jgi:hypothetical protein